MPKFLLRPVISGAVAAALLAGFGGTALAFGGGGGGGNSGSGLSPYAADSGNDRSAGVNNGNYSPPRYNYYRRAYGPRDAPYPRRRYRNSPY